MKKHSPFAVIGTIFTLIGLVLLIVSGIFYSAHTTFIQNAKETTAVIDTIAYDNSSRSDTNHRVLVKYTVDNKEYLSRLNYYTFNMAEGQSVKVYYNIADPSQIKTDNIPIAVMTLGIVGIVFLLVGLSFVMVKGIKSSQKKRLIANGNRIFADFSDIVANTQIMMNGKHPYNIICHWKNPLDGKLYILKSENVWVNPRSIIESREITSFPVYMDVNNPKKYYISLDRIEENTVDLT